MERASEDRAGFHEMVKKDLDYLEKAKVNMPDSYLMLQWLMLTTHARLLPATSSDTNSTKLKNFDEE